MLESVTKISFSKSLLLWMCTAIMSFVSVYCNIHEDVACDAYMAPSTIANAGRGIFTAKLLNEADMVEDSPTLTVDNRFCEKWTLNNYVYSSNIDSRSLVTFGLAMLYNHQTEDDKNVYHQWSSYDVFCDAEGQSAHSTSTQVSYYAMDGLSPGDELFTSYGDSWFDGRFIALNDTTKAVASFNRDVEYLKAHGICMTHIYVSQSKLPMAGKGIFAKKAFQEGEIIYVSPVLLLPKHEVIEASNDSVLLNYCIAPLSEIDIAILPIGLSAMANHQGRQLANMAYRWTAESLKALEQDPKLLLKLPYAPLDLEYYALRDIAAEEELTLDYGEEWINAWSLFVGLKFELSLIGELGKHPYLKFRHPIIPPVDLIPGSWTRLTCIGQSCIDSSINVAPPKSGEL